MTRTKKGTGSKTTEAIKAEVLEAALVDIPFDGWTTSALRRACEAQGIDAKEMDLIWPGGAMDLLEDFSHWADAKMTEALEEADLAAMKIRERITFAVQERVKALEEHREAALRAATMLALPNHAVLAARLLARTVDLVWRGIGDTSTDFNFYTKRATLSLVYSSTLMVWMTDESGDLSDTFAFLDRRIENVMQFEKVKARVKKDMEKLPDPARILARLRG